VIADRTAYDVRYTGKLSNRFRLQVYERLVPAVRKLIERITVHARSTVVRTTIKVNGIQFMNAPKHYLLKRCVTIERVHEVSE